MATAGPEACFPAGRLARLAAMEARHFWFSGRLALVRRLLARYVEAGCPALDLGCGTGHVVEALRRRGHAVVGLDIRREGLEAIRRRGSPRTHPVQGHAGALPFASGRFGLVTILDVLEHVADDRGLLAEARRVLRPGGTLLLTVPAGPWLWSHRDEAAGHRRRYTAEGLRTVLSHARLTAHDVRYYQCLLFPVVAASRWLGRRGLATRDAEDTPPRLLNLAFGAVTRLELRLGDVVRWPFGASVVAVCRPA
jgi:SAM-dependent methyltransferase